MNVNPETSEDLLGRRRCRGSWEYHGSGNLVGGLEHDFYDFPYLGNNNPHIPH